MWLECPFHRLPHLLNLLETLKYPETVIAHHQGADVIETILTSITFTGTKEFSALEWVPICALCGSWLARCPVQLLYCIATAKIPQARPS